MGLKPKTQTRRGASVGPRHVYEQAHIDSELKKIVV
jgi:hypothetical protein